LSRMHARGPGRSPAGFVVIVGIYIILWINAKHSDRMGSDPSIALVGMVTCDTVTKDENGMEISRTDRFRFLYYDSVFKHKKLSVSIGFTTIFNHFLYSLIDRFRPFSSLTITTSACTTSYRDYYFS
jgi:hypothetical protein